MAKFRKVIKTGNSLAVTIPSKLINDLGIKEGDVAQTKINKSKTRITYVFIGKARQLSLVGK